MAVLRVMADDHRLFVSNDFSVYRIMGKNFEIFLKSGCSLSMFHVQ